MNDKAVAAADPVGTLHRLQREIGDWSLNNFGDNTSKHTGHQLGATAPLLGMNEELGELATARWGTLDRTEQEDAVADILVYLCDFANRDQMDLVSNWDKAPLDSYEDGYVMAVAGLNKITHAHLKRHQGIRGFDRPNKYRAERNEGVALLTTGLAVYCADNFELGTTPLVLLEAVWSKVKQRNWVTNPEDANEVAC